MEICPLGSFSFVDVCPFSLSSIEDIHHCVYVCVGVGVGVDVGRTVSFALSVSCVHLLHIICTLIIHGLFTSRVQLVQTFFNVSLCNLHNILCV